MKYLLIFFGLILLFSSCKKKQTKLIHISAKNPETGVSYPNLTYTISEEILGTDEPIKVIMSGILDAKGQANFELRIKKNHVYLLKLNEPPNIGYKNFQDTIFITYEYKDFNFDYEFIPCAYLKLDIKNVNCSTGNDAIQVWATYLGEFNSFSTNYPNSLYRSAHNCEDFISYDVAVKQGLYCIKRNIMKTPTWEYQYDTIYLQANEHKIYEVNY